MKAAVNTAHRISIYTTSVLHWTICFLGTKCRSFVLCVLNVRSAYIFSWSLTAPKNCFYHILPFAWRKCHNMKDFCCFQQVYHQRSVRAEVTERTETFLSLYFKDRAFSSACHHLQQLSPLFQVMLFEPWVRVSVKCWMFSRMEQTLWCCVTLDSADRNQSLSIESVPSPLCPCRKVIV